MVLKKDIYVDDAATFTCNVRANPAAEIFWLYEGRFINKEEQRAQYSYGDCNSTLTIPFAEPRDTGRYTCMARNSYGKTISNTIVLAVQQKGNGDLYYILSFPIHHNHFTAEAKLQ